MNVLGWDIISFLQKEMGVQVDNEMLKQAE